MHNFLFWKEQSFKNKKNQIIMNIPVTLTSSSSAEQFPKKKKTKKTGLVLHFLSDYFSNFGVTKI